MIRKLNTLESPEQPAVVMRKITDPKELARLQEHQLRADRNWAWFQAHAPEIYKNRGKCVCVSGQELFIADTPEEVVACAEAAHPEDKGYILHYIRKEKGDRIYAH